VTLTDGTYRLGPSSGRLLIKTGRAGLGRKAGYDLTIEATRWSCQTVVAVADPDRSSVSVTVETGSMEVREATGGLKPLTDTDRAEFERTLADKALLHTAEHPRSPSGLPGSREHRRSSRSPESPPSRAAPTP
jgi:polyisoprenoid-binding protein YceI